MDRMPRGDRMDRVEAARVPRTREPIYARLVAEWRAQGRTVPTGPEVPWTSLAGLADLAGLALRTGSGTEPSGRF
ncbi:hypothetical protein FRZ03_29730 [Streptomyces misionensis]|uniref:Uncharacterized protein n=1 Tax=Streptomyces misionensis TaxID=67331 RepID=A0A5C6IZS5_9ACTN|nr:hypothetical protein FRZ03_29730 [Streptomyces misionensis]